MFEISHVMPITQLIVFLHFEMYHKNCVNIFYPMFTHVWNFTYNTTYIFNCLSPYWKVPYSSKQFLLYVYPLFLWWYVYDKWSKHLPVSLPCKQGKCSLFTFLHIDNFAKPKYTLTFTWFEIFWCICSFTQLICCWIFVNLPYQIDILKLIYTYPTLVYIPWNQNNISNYHVHSTQHMYIHNKMST